MFTVNQFLLYIIRKIVSLYNSFDSIWTDLVHGESTDHLSEQCADNDIVDHKAPFDRTSSGHQHNAPRVRHHSTVLRAEHNNANAEHTDDTDYNQFLDDLLMDDEYQMLDKSYYVPNNHFNRTHHHSGEPISSVLSTSSDAQWSSDDEDEDTSSLNHCSDPEVDQIMNSSTETTDDNASFTSSHISERALRALSRNPLEYTSSDLDLWKITYTHTQKNTTCKQTKTLPDIHKGKRHN